MECIETLRRKKLPKIQIFATDLDPEAIEHGRAGSYHDNIIADVSPERLEKFFIKKDNHYTVKKDLREMIVFAQHNLIKDAPFTRLDLDMLPKCDDLPHHRTYKKRSSRYFITRLTPKALCLWGLQKL
jgi:chemotaxis methyl-accepting protein methylase